MLKSEMPRFIFIHIYKTAGTSITNALTPFATNRWPLFIERLFRKTGIETFNLKPYHDHIRAKELIEKIGVKKFNSYFSFAFVRNPWDWQVSLYTYMLKKVEHHQHDFVKNLGSFDRYIEWRCEKEIRFQKDFIYSDDDELLVDFVGRYEKLDADFKTICEKIGIAVELPVLNVSKSKPYQKYYAKESIELVRRTFAPDIELFKYEFE